MDLELRRAAVDRAYRDHVDDVYRVAYAILRDADAAVDVTHDAFARAFERWSQYDPDRPLRPWLLGIASHIALDVVRRRRSYDVAIAALGTRGSPFTAPPNADAAGAVDRRELVEAALAELRPPARAAVVLRHYYGYDYSQIAAILGTNSGTVGSLLSRAHASLRDRLAEARPDSGRGESSTGSVPAG